VDLRSSLNHNILVSVSMKAYVDFHLAGSCLLRDSEVGVCKNCSAGGPKPIFLRHIVRVSGYRNGNAYLIAKTPTPDGATTIRFCTVLLPYGKGASIKAELLQVGLSYGVLFLRRKKNLLGVLRGDLE